MYSHGQNVIEPDFSILIFIYLFSCIFIYLQEEQTEGAAGPPGRGRDQEAEDHGRHDEGGRGGAGRQDGADLVPRGPRNS